MNWKHLLFLVAGFAAGLLVGLSRSPAPETRAPGRHTATARVVPEASGEAPVSARVETEYPPTEVDEVALRAPLPIEPQGAISAGLDVSEGYGVIEVDFTGIECDPEFSVDVRRLSGEWDEIGGCIQERGSRIASAELPPGIHAPYWRLPGWQGRWGVRVRVREGQVTRVDAASAGVFELPARRGLARLDLTVRDLKGEPLSGLPLMVEGTTSAGRDSVDGQTDEQGRCRLEVLPGARTIVVGARRVPVQLIEGQSAVVEIEPAGQGMILFEPPGLGSNVWVKPLGDDVEWVDSRFFFDEGGKLRHGVAYLAPGEYRITCGTHSFIGRPLGRVSIRSGQTTRVHLSGGYITCRVSIPDTYRRTPLRDVKVYAAPHSASTQQGGAWLSSLSKGSLNIPRQPEPSALLGIPYVPPGRYRVWAEAGKFRSEKTIVDVDETSVEVQLVLLPAAR
ncbi:MAG: hypothetical protein ACYSX0_10445 [Planctomycetota bacterium]